MGAREGPDHELRHVRVRRRGREHLLGVNAPSAGPIAVEVDVLGVPGASVGAPDAGPALEGERRGRDVPEEKMLDVVPLDDPERHALAPSDRCELPAGQNHGPPDRLSITCHRASNRPRRGPSWSRTTHTREAEAWRAPAS